MIKYKISSYLRTLIPVIICLLSISGCDITDVSDSSDSTEWEVYYSELEETLDWSETTHEKLSTDKIIDNIDVIFDQTSVQKLRIVIEPENWSIMNDDFEELVDELNGSTDFNSLDNPIFVPSEVFYYSEENDSWTEWYKVGIRFKGNSSLFNANSYKLPFKLDFDEFEDEYPAIENQRFYGFKQLNLKNNYNDESEMHEVVANELFRDFGLTSAHSSFYAVYLNVDGTDDESYDIYYGLYSLVEEIDDTVIKTQYYDNDDGNLYKPEDEAASFAGGSYDEDEYGLKTDDDETYTDIKTLYDAINDSPYNANWKNNLEEIFNVDIFLKWLAANTVMQNWDTYGVMTHNFFLYNNPETGTFEWIPWDNNEALVDNSRALSLEMSSIDSEEWPLIGNILTQNEYQTTYESYIKEFSKNYFDKGDSTEFNVNDRFADYQDLIEDNVIDEGYNYTFTSESEFTDAIDELIDHTQDRYKAASDYVGW